MPRERHDRSNLRPLARARAGQGRPDRRHRRKAIDREGVRQLRAGAFRGQVPGTYASSWKQWSRLSYPFAKRLARDAWPLNVMTRMWFSVLTQDHTADVNITGILDGLAAPVRLEGRRTANA